MLVSFTLAPLMQLGNTENFTEKCEKKKPTQIMNYANDYQLISGQHLVHDLYITQKHSVVFIHFVLLTAVLYLLFTFMDHPLNMIHV